MFFQKVGVPVLLLCFAVCTRVSILGTQRRNFQKLNPKLFTWPCLFFPTEDRQHPKSSLCQTLNRKFLNHVLSAIGCSICRACPSPDGDGVYHLVPDHLKAGSVSYIRFFFFLVLGGLRSWDEIVQRVASGRLEYVAFDVAFVGAWVASFQKNLLSLPVESELRPSPVFFLNSRFLAILQDPPETSTL